jgi:tetratricopeptide (TPR) repeat protein
MRGHGLSSFPDPVMTDHNGQQVAYLTATIPSNPSPAFKSAGHFEVGVARTNLAATLHRQGRLDEAETEYRRGLAIREREGGPDHPELAPALANLAKLLSQTDRDHEAESLYRRALAITDEALTPEHPTRRACAHALAELVAARGIVIGSPQPVTSRGSPRRPRRSTGQGLR